MSDARYTLIMALYILCSEYHSGQWSRGYRLMSRIATRYRPEGVPTMARLAYSDEWADVYEKYLELKEQYVSTL